MKKIIIPIALIALLSFDKQQQSYKDKAFQAIQVQQVLKEELFEIYLNEGSIEAESRYVDAKYVESLLKEILNTN